MQKHVQICNPQFKEGDDVIVVEEGINRGYRLESTEKAAASAPGTPAPGTHASDILGPAQ